MSSAATRGRGRIRSSEDRRSLTEIANFHGTDKGTVGPSADWPAHNYTDIYEAYLSPYRNRDIRVLEIGLGVPGEAWTAKIAHGRNLRGGGSLKMWYDYFPRGRIYGVDINPAAHLDNDRIATYVVDQGDPVALNAFLWSLGRVTFDIIVDDGSHRPDHQQLSLGVLFRRLRPGGLYFIEDLLKNGKGDGKTGRMAVDSVLNTRRVLRKFRMHGQFDTPHGLVNEDYLARHIDCLNFHVPGRRAPGGHETLVAIRKKCSPLLRSALNSNVSHRILQRRGPHH